jgi:hypothetical protein
MGELSSGVGAPSIVEEADGTVAMVGGVLLCGGASRRWGGVSSAGVLGPTVARGGVGWTPTDGATRRAR